MAAGLASPAFPPLERAGDASDLLGKGKRKKMKINERRIVERVKIAEARVAIAEARGTISKARGE